MISEKDIIYVTKRQASIVTAVLVILGLFLFCLGYFWGKQSIFEDFNQKVAQDSVNDLNYLESMQSFAEKMKSQEKESSKSVDSIENAKEIAEDTTHANNETERKQEESDQVKSAKKTYKAILIGFGTKNAAAGFVNRLKKQNIMVDIRARKSKTSSGKIAKTWYQVITKSYESKEELQKIINKIQKTEKLKSNDIKII